MGGNCENMAGPTGHCAEHEAPKKRKKRAKPRMNSEAAKRRAWRQRSIDSQARLLKRFG